VGARGNLHDCCFFLAPFYTAVSYNPAQMINTIAKFVPQKDDQFFRDYIALLKKQDVDQAYALLSPEGQQASTHDALLDVAMQFASTTSDIAVVGADISYAGGASPYTSYQMTCQIANNDPEMTYMLVAIGARDLGQGIKIDGVHVEFRAQSLTDGGKFHFPKPDWSFVVAILALCTRHTDT
jgi:hypothetical protein